jgi:hypothetical protein
MTEKEVEEATLISRAFDSGNCDSAYVSEDLDTAWEKDQGGENPTPVKYRAAYVVAFFGTHELDEIPSEYREEFEQAWHSPVGKAVRTAGYVDPRPEMELDGLLLAKF